MSSGEILLVYDKECPLCDNFNQAIRVRKTVGDLRIIDARQSSQVMDEISAHGLDIDQGMVLKMGDQMYYGADAIHALALIGSRSGIFNRISYWMFRSKTASHFLYPILRSIRNLLLKILGRTKINNLRNLCISLGESSREPK
ncbi:MAG: DUF393 domain-containing protein [Gammaproteobacteria bacterium]|nr:DUF393 domain-containing protein [Gammaproteobacteria bacterium]